MRRSLLVLAGLAAATVPQLTGAVPHARAPHAFATRTVSVHVRCEGGRLAAAEVNPDPVTLVQGDSLAWALTDSSDAESFTIEPSTAPGQTKPWPFADEAETRRGRKRSPARGRRMRANAEGRYRYNIVAECPTGRGDETREVEIDPDIIIRAR